MTTVRSYDRLFIGGRWVRPASDAMIEVISPVTEEVIATVPEASPDDMDAAVAAAREAFDHGPWPRISPAERAAALRRVGTEIRKRVPEMEASFTAEIGAPVAVSRAFHANAVSMWDDAASLHEKVAFEERRAWDGGEALIIREPVGVVATVIPWNGPVATASMKISCPGRWVLRRAQARARGPGQHPAARRGAGSGGPSGGRGQRAARRPGER